MKKISNKILYIIAALAAFLLVISAFASERPIGFPDVPASSCYYDAVTYFAGKGVVSGQEDGQFHPDDILTSDEWSGILDSIHPYFLCQRLSIHLGDVRGEDLRRKGVWF